MVSIGFTSTASKLKDEVKALQDAGSDVFGVALINDADGKHEIIKSSNAQMHLFMKMKKGIVKDVVFGDIEQATVFKENASAFFGKDAAGPIFDRTSFVVIGCADSDLASAGYSDIVSLPDMDAVVKRFGQ